MRVPGRSAQGFRRTNNTQTFGRDPAKATPRDGECAVDRLL